jgi:predicted unusual protein kinase regulating ubiquinone biosynthesis (AarF/ABC1/UbiB family)
MFLGAIQRDARTVVGRSTRWASGGFCDREVIERIASKMLDRFATMPAGDLREMDPREVMDDVESVFYDNPLRIPAQFASSRAASMLMGLTVQLSPSFNFAEVATPYAQKFLGAMASARSSSSSASRIRVNCQWTSCARRPRWRARWATSRVGWIVCCRARSVANCASSLRIPRSTPKEPGTPRGSPLSC